ncbi:1,2-diacylglycerol-3-alpha-glucose alpha-1,2-galactosyltransferase [Bacilli bacterium PM5-3]|nr:1,2-diacylglycerol-3-alpha-glucose alpha-1,2-galactosyltransferase [Bacilli bacterium PM5-3]MDH6604355.1 1,2-diacylglycerol-3-alpha-glucose alpha-1,2-galactosyltransferase [Bacilli bacterium PM5-9]
MNDFSINMLSQADDVPGQGVGSAYIEQVKLVEEGSKGKFKVYVNDKNIHDIQHHHTINYGNFVKLKRGGSINVTYVHFLPHTLDGSIKLPKLIFDVFKKYVIRFYRSSDALVVVNPIFIDELIKYGIEKEKIHYIPNFVSKENFFHESEEVIEKTKLKYDIPLDKKIILGVGQVQTRKGVLDFIEVAKSLPEIMFVWCGGFSFGNITDGYKELKEISENPPTNVKFLGIVPREEMNDIYNIADILFVPSYNELFPMAILEAVNSGVPLLLRDLELYKDILFQKYLSANSNDKFIEAIEFLLNDEKEYKKYSDYSIDISNYYSKENVYNQWENFYYKIYDENYEKIDKEKIEKQQAKTLKNSRATR